MPPKKTPTAKATPPKKMETAELLATYANSYLRDDGIVMIETQPGQFVSQTSLANMGQMPAKPTPKE